MGIDHQLVNASNDYERPNSLGQTVVEWLDDLQQNNCVHFTVYSQFLLSVHTF